MKTLKTDINGGFPFELDDLRWIENGIREALAMAAQMTGSEFTIVNPAIVTTPSGGDLDVTHGAGKVFVDGEFCDIDALVSPLFWDVTAGDAIWWEKETSFDPAGSEVFENATTNDTYQIVKWKLATGATAPVGSKSLYDWTNETRRIPDIILNKIIPLEFIHENKVIFKNAAGVTTLANNADGGFTGSLDAGSNAQIVEFTTPVVDFLYMQNNAVDQSGMWRLIKFVGTAGSTDLIIRHETSSALAGSKFKFKCPQNCDRLVRSGDICLFWNDGSFWNLIAGGRPLQTGISGIYSGTWTDAPFTNGYYSKDADGIVRLSGSVAHASYTQTTNDLIFTLPAGFRPRVNEAFSVLNQSSGHVVANITVLPNGQVRFLQIGATGVSVFVALSSVSFVAYY